MKRNSMIILGIIVFVWLFYMGGLQRNQSMNGNAHKIAVIKQDRKVVERIDLNMVSEPRKMKLPGRYHEIIAVEKGRIRFEEADCPDKICVKTGWLQEPGDSAVCIPNRAVISIEN